ncbi:MAG: class I SAM-dependent methyltransferase [Candidatus Izemoplasmatales bacterium]
MDKETAARLSAQNRDNYDSFSGAFAQTRSYLWPEMAALAEGNFKEGDSVLDIGCGNGRFYPFFKERGGKYFGIDNSRNLIAIARESFPGAEFAVADALALPFKDNEFDLAVSIAALHHIPSKEFRKIFFKEARRVLKPGGILVATVWDLRPQTMIKAKQWKRLKNFAKTQFKIAAGLEKLDFGDFFIAWQNKYERFHHAFALRELRELAAASGFEIEKNGATSFGAKEGNLYIVAKKLHN